MNVPFKSYDRFEQAELARRETPDPFQQRWRRKAFDLRAKARRCRLDSVRHSLLDIGDTYDRLADAASENR
jgi:hypothetical protein